MLGRFGMSGAVNPQLKGDLIAIRPAPVRTVLVSAAVFGAAYAVVGVAVMAFAIFGRSRPGEPTTHLFGNFLMAGYLTGISSVMNAIAFTMLVACSVHWRRLPTMGAAGRSSVFGAAAFLITMTGLHYQVLRSISIVKLVPVLAVWLPYLLPGILMGMLAVIALGLASFVSKQKPETHPDTKGA